MPSLLLNLFQKQYKLMFEIPNAEVLIYISPGA